MSALERIETRTGERPPRFDPAFAHEPAEPVAAPRSRARTLALHVDLAGSLSNAIDALNGEKGWTHPYRDPPGEEDRDSAVATLEMIREHVLAVRKGDKTTLAQFCELYGLAPGAMLYGREP